MIIGITIADKTCDEVILIAGLSHLTVTALYWATIAFEGLYQELLKSSLE